MDSFSALSPSDAESHRSEDLPAQRDASRKLHKSRRDDHPAAHVELPEPLKHRDSDDEDSPNDPASRRGRAMSVNMNQSIFGLIAAAGSRVDFNARFDDGSSDDEDSVTTKNPPASSHDLSQTIILPTRTRDEKRGHGKKLSTSQRLLRSISTLPKRRSRKNVKSRLSAPPLDSSDGASTNSGLSQSMVLPAQRDNDCLSPVDDHLAPVMSRMLQARAEMAARPSFDSERQSGDLAETEDGDGDQSSALAKRLMEIFEFDEPEHVVEEYPCWFLQSVLLQGFLYITAKHICFYAYLPRKANVLAKAGYLFKSGKRYSKHHRYWFRLKGDVLSYYQDSTNLYFPHGQIDLRFGISSNITDKDKDGVHFDVVTSNRTYNFKADSAPSAREWVKSLQRVIFRSHNEGDSVKISLPIDNIIDVEETRMMEFSDTCKIRVIDNDETFAMDEYFFSFFNFGKEAISLLKSLVDSTSPSSRTPAQLIFKREMDQHARAEQSLGQASSGSSKTSPRPGLPVDQNQVTKLPEVVKATLSPPMSPRSPLSSSPSPRPSFECSTRPSLDAFRQISRQSHEAGTMREQSPRRSFSGQRRIQSPRRQDDKKGKQPMESSDSCLLSSTEDPSFSNLTISAATEDPSASQILQGSEVFHSPTIHQTVASSADGRDDDQYEQAGAALPGASIPVGHAATTGHINELGYHGKSAHQPQRSATPTLQSISKMGAYPLQRAGAFADYLNKTGKRMSSLLATESMGYVEKVSDMWKGGRKHYGEPAGLRPDEDDLEEDSDGKIQTSMERFRAHFALPEGEKLRATYFGSIIRVLPLYGKIYISDRSFCFRSLLPGTRTKLILPLKDIETAQKEKGFRISYSGLTIVIRGHEELFFEFGEAEVRDDCAVTLLQTLDTCRFLRESGILQLEEKEEQEVAKAERDALRSARQEGYPHHEVQLPRETDSSQPNAPPILSDDTDGSFLNFKPSHPVRITCLTIGSRGDVQPYIALCKGLIAEGHQARIATHAEFQDWIESHGIEFRKVEGDPGELMRLCIENGTFTLSFLREANSAFRGWLDELLDSAYTACEGSELLIESPSAMAGIHIAEKLSIPYFRAFTMPWTRTRAYPHAFIMPEHKMGGAYNYMTYVMFDNIFWKATAQQINRWRNKTLGLPNTSLEKMQPNKVPFLYNFSPSVVAPPLDFSDWIRVTGYWFLDEGQDFEAPEELTDFIKKARSDGKKLVYIGFGSIIVNDPVKMTHEVIEAVLKADVRCILSKGWSDRISPKDDPLKRRPEEPEMPPEILVIKSAPHDWLFKQIDAAAHHGGSGTTGASLRAGIPTIIRPFFGDQYFFASRVEDLGVGVGLRKWGARSFGRALWEVTRNERMIVKARVLGEQIRKDKGVETAIQNIYRDLEYAKSLIKRKVGQSDQPDAEEEEDEEETEESWTFVGSDEPDPEMVTRKLSEGIRGVPTKGPGSKASQG